MILKFYFLSLATLTGWQVGKKESRDLVTRNISCFITVDLKENHKDAGMHGRCSTRMHNLLLQ